MNRDELLERSRPTKAEHGTFPSSKLQMGILRTIVGPATGFAIVSKSQVTKGSSVGPKLICHQNMRATMPLHRFHEEFQCGFSIPALGDKGFQDFAFVIDGPPQVVGDTVDLYEDGIQMPPPVGQGEVTTQCRLFC